MSPLEARRTGDEVSIEGGYQHVAITRGHPVQRFWHHSKLMAISSLLPPHPGDFVLDIGCGSGVVSNHLAQAGAKVLAVDGNDKAIEYARREFACDQIEFRLGLVDEHLSVDRPVDKAYCLELIEHIHYPQARALLDNTRAVLRPGGQLFLTTPNYRSAWPAIEWLMDRTSRAPKLAEAQHVDFYHWTRLQRLVEESGFEIEFMTTKCGLAPWLAPVSWNLALRCQKAELTSGWRLGSILVCVARAL